MTMLTGEKISGKHTFQRGIHPPHRKKLSQSQPIEQILPKSGQTFVVPMQQHLGAPCQPTVEAKQQVTAGQQIGASDAFVSAAVHSPVNGTVKEISVQPHPSGVKVLSVVITADENQPEPAPWKDWPGDFDGDSLDSATILQRIRQAGLVGQGGAAFPTVVKLTPNDSKPVDTILINGCECEPYLTSDHRLMIEAPGPILAGLLLAMKAAKAPKGIIAVEDNKPDAVNVFTAAIRNIDNLKLAICQTKYPQGGERQLIKAVLNRDVPTGGLPLDVGVVVINAGTTSSIAWASAQNRPLIERIVTVTGNGIKNPGNFRVPIGMLLSDLIEHAGGLTDDVAKVLLGGPMMGPTTAHLNLPILKGTSGIVALTHDDISLYKETACIRCSRCVDHCPIGLVPTRIAHAVKARDIDMAIEYDLLACIECGCCTYVCPAKIPLIQYLRSGKQLAREKQSR